MGKIEYQKIYKKSLSKIEATKVRGKIFKTKLYIRLGLDRENKDSILWQLMP